MAITHNKVNQITDFTQFDLDTWIQQGIYPAGTTLADITLPSDWNDDHTGTLPASSVDVTASSYQVETDAQSAFDLIGANLRGAQIVDMNNDNHTLPASEAESTIIVVVNSGDGTKTLTWPSSADGRTPADISLITTFTVNPFYIVSETGGSSILITAPAYDIIGFSAGSAPVSFYNANISALAYSSDWSADKMAATKGAIYDKMETMSDNAITQNFLLMGG